MISLKSSDAATDKFGKLTESFPGKTGFDFGVGFGLVCLFVKLVPVKSIAGGFGTEVGNTEIKTEAAKYF